MKKFYILMLASILLPEVLSAQTSITLTFTATLNGDHQPLDSILIENLTQGGDTTLYGNDTVLVLQQPIGISDPGKQPVGGMILQPAFPNPFNGSTTIGFYLAQQEQVALGLYDPLGREVARLEDMFPAGGHRISLHAGNGGFYLFSVETPRFRQVQKLMPIGRSNVDCRIEYAGWQPGSSGMKKDRANFLWAPGDNLRFIGYTSNGADTIDAAPVQSTQYTFQFLPQSPPPVANFSASDTAIYQNDTVQFTDLSLHSPTTWKWYFGDGDSSVLQNPSHIYTTAGNYTVSLIAGNTSGYDTITKINHIEVDISCP
ncbi:MAG: PKD domain-containing protein, partial [Lentimicrobiaceae bacterium]|nr:PKD domain-containing protein [Lentimicrobiaceae bacterium]